MKLTREEEFIRRQLTPRLRYPRWGYVTGPIGFLLYVEPNAWVEEAAKQPDGTWSIGQKSDGTQRTFPTLQEALNYGELLNNRRELVDLKARFEPEEYSSYARELHLDDLVLA
jgi:hypothetical protein